MEMGESANELNRRFVLSLKNVGMPAEPYKARLVAQGHGDIEMLFLVHDSSALKPSSPIIILSFAIISGYTLLTQEGPIEGLHTKLQTA